MLCLEKRRDLLKVKPLQGKEREHIKKKQKIGLVRKGVAKIFKDYLKGEIENFEKYDIVILASHHCP